MRNLPYYRLWVKDFDTNESVRELNLAEAGLFLFALNHAWVNDGLPADPESIRRVLKISPSEFRRHWPLVAKCFYQDSSNRLRNKRQEEERAEALSASVRNTANVRRRYDKPTTVEESYPSGSTTRGRANESESVSDSEGGSKELSLQDDFHRFTEACAIAEMVGSESDLFMARTWWVRLDLADRLAAVAGIKDRVAAGEYDEARYRPLPQNYLQQKLWQRTIRPRAAPMPEKIHTKRNEVLQLSKVFSAMRNQK